MTTSPTPSLPAAIREALDAYELACYRHQARQVLETFTEATGARRALEAHLLALSADAERWRHLANQRAAVHQRPFSLTLHVNSFVSLAEHVDAWIARTPPEDTTPHE